MGSIPDEVIGFFIWPNLSSPTMALGSSQPLTEISTRNLTIIVLIKTNMKVTFYEVMNLYLVFPT
jgi:hypothetical protein